ncbi:DUF506 domain-containing protein [Heracleum sosnowskyi]|uniref:DUF506 domain-containing protein n=1 Tax=Heracleum sosnowskyi TaxID=360622 RepID=A0AAD8JEJ1_9APIA|nr:DUF506 domain-containing protein [Heracleum sosnowskyi]
MAKAAVRFKRVAEAFDMAARARVICGESSGSERQSSPAPESFIDLSDLVNSFIDGEEIDNGMNYKEYNKFDEISDENDGGDYWEDCMDLLREYLEEKSGDHNVRMKIQSEVESACRGLGLDRSSPEFKRKLMTRLRERGFDAGLCKSKWGKTTQLTPGNYEYVDVNLAGHRYIVEVLMAGEFQVARSTDRYASLLKILPPIFVGKAETLKQIVRLMCRAIKKSMKRYEMHLPPWRRYAYMQAKWFSSSYKRTINEISDKNGFNAHEKTEKRAVGFVPMPVMNSSYFCREAFVSKVGSNRVGNLAMVMNGNELLL